MSLHRRVWRQLALLVVPLAIVSCDDGGKVQPSEGRPLTTAEFLDRFGNRGWDAPGGGGGYFNANDMTIHLDNNCYAATGALEFVDGELRFPSDGLQAPEVPCEGVEPYDANWVFGTWMVEPDGSVVVIAGDASEHPVTEF